MELVVALTQHTAGRHGGLRHDNHLILELIHHVLMGQRPDVVAAAADEQFKVCQHELLRIQFSNVHCKLISLSDRCE